jgi:glutathionylspermidine synthase
MERIDISPRSNWEDKIKSQGFLFYKGYYNETAAYEFSMAEVDRIEIATGQLFDRCLDVVQHVIDNNLWDEFFIPKKFADLITWSWNNDNPSFYGRFDLAVSKDCNEIKMLEFNADTPTSLLEASVIQWYWLQEFNPKFDQYNSIHEKIVAHMKICKDYLYGNLKMHFACARNSSEDLMTVKYLQDCADQAKIKNDFLYINEIGVQDTYLQTPFCTPSGTAINNIFKLYPYEWLFNEKFADSLNDKRDLTLWVEPPYKALLSNKMLLVYLHKLFPNHPNILPSFYSDKDNTSFSKGQSFVKKPVFGREGNNVVIYNSDHEIIERNTGEYGHEGYIYQQYYNIPKFGEWTPVIGSWLIGGIPAGMGIKEITGLIHGNMSKFAAHYIK